jgi:hypothetical protein
LAYFKSFLFIYCQYWSMNSGPHACWAGVLHLEPHTLPFFALVIFCMGSLIFAQGSLGYNASPPTQLGLQTRTTTLSLFVES